MGINSIEWTVATYAAYNEARRDDETKFQFERDRRYTEINIEKEKALKIKETADLAALELARESQKYKEERNDAMREQNIGDRGAYATHADVAMVVERMERSLKPLVDFANKQQGQDQGAKDSSGKIYGMIALICTVFGTVFLLISKF